MTADQHLIQIDKLDKKITALSSASGASDALAHLGNGTDLRNLVKINHGPGMPGVSRSQRALTKSLEPVTPNDIAATLTLLEASPDSQAMIDDARADIDEFGLDAFFQALPQTPAAQRTAIVQTARQQIESAQPPVEKDVFARRGDEGVMRATWRDCIGSQVIQPLRVFYPTTLDDLRSILRQATQDKCRVRAVGSGHSFSDVASTTDFLIETHGLNHILDLETALLRPDAAGPWPLEGPLSKGHLVEAGTLFATECGITVHDLNETLWNRGLGLINMGGFDGQTLMGVVSTSTHGSGLSFPPLADFVVSMTIVIAEGRTIRVEPHNGITDPDKWKAAHADIDLIQDDDWFHACQVGIGCMGVAYSVIMRMRKNYWMREERTLTRWSAVKPILQDAAVLHDSEHWELLINPYETHGDHTCLITKRTALDEEPESSEPQPHRNFLVELIARYQGSGAIMLELINHCPDLVPTIIDKALQSLERPYVDRSYRVYNIGTSNDVPAYGSEIGFALDQYIGATERILTIAANAQRVGKAYLTSPMSLRFCSASQAYLSMMHGGETCMIEFPMLANTIGGRELLRRIEEEMFAFGGRPHWGLLNFWSGDQSQITQMYPMFPHWLNVYRQLNIDGMFENAFTQRCGISQTPFMH